MAHFSLRTNDRVTTVDADPDTPLLYVLRNELGPHGGRPTQCGSCTTGMVMTARALLLRTPRPTAAQVPLTAAKLTLALDRV